MALNQDSRYNRTVVIQLVERSGRTRRPFVDPPPRFSDINRPSNRLYRLKQVDHWHRLAYQRYGRGQDYWAILEFNEVVDPFDELESGRRIVLPSNDVVQFDVKDFDVGSNLEAR